MGVSIHIPIEFRIFVSQEEMIGKWRGMYDLVLQHVID